QANSDFLLLNHVLAAGLEVDAQAEPAATSASLTNIVLSVPANDKAREIVGRLGNRVRASLVSRKATPPSPSSRRYTLRPTKIGVYQPWVPSMDEGWTRLVLETFDFPYVTLHNADIKAADLNTRIDTLLIPS